MTNELPELTIDGVEVITSEDVQQAREKHREIAGEVELAMAVDISSEQSYRQAVEALDRLKAVYDVVESILEPLRKSAYDHYVEVREYKKAVLGEAEDAIDHIRDEMARWAKKQEEALAEQKQEAVASLEEGDEVPEFDEPVPEMEGVSYRDKWSAGWASDDEEACLRELCAAVAEGEVDPSLVEVNWSEANRRARKLKRAFFVPGLKMEHEKTTVVRR